ncbi:MAG: hypothetical protein O7E51_01830 [Acidobacteria bacterium]|nr:hypothetical protein [Acidobacteriota bacterium]
MRTLLHRCIFATLLAAVAVGILAGQTDVEALRIKAEQGGAEALRWYRLAAAQLFLSQAGKQTF